MVSATFCQVGVCCSVVGVGVGGVFVAGMICTCVPDDEASDTPPVSASASPLAAGIYT